MFSAFLDTSVLWPSVQRDLLLALAVEGAYRALWSDAILHELRIHEAAKLVNRHGFSQPEARRRAERLIDQMSLAFDDSCVTGWEPLEGTYGLPDPDDEHVVAGAVVGGAEVIVTSNLKDFPAARLPAAMRATSPAAFVDDTVRLHPDIAHRAVLALCSRRRGADGESMHPDELLALLRGRYGMHGAVEVLATLLPPAG